MSLLQRVNTKLKLLQEGRSLPYGWSGNYTDWNTAEKLCSGYTNTGILEKVKDSLLKVKNGEAAYERDSVLFNRKEYSWPLLTALLRAASENNGNLNVLDFGGSLGSSYFQNKEMLGCLNQLRWIVVEQEHFNAYGRQYFKTGELDFADTISDAQQMAQPDVLLFSGVLQYVPDPELFINQAIQTNATYLVVDRTSFISGSTERIMIQRVPPEIYEAAYPVRFFNEDRFLQLFKGYTVLAKWPSYCETNRLSTDGKRMEWHGFLFKKEI